jgi:CheY-like chemotaxis protein
LQYAGDVNDLDCKLSNTTSVGEVAEIVCTAGTLTLGADRVGMWIVEGGLARPIGDGVGAVALDDESHPIAHAIRTPRGQWLRSDRAITNAVDRVRAACVLPLIVDDRTIGAVAFTFTNDHLLQVEERELVFEIAAAIAAHAARALERVRLAVPEPHTWPAGTQPFVTAAAPRRQILIVGDRAEAEPFAEALEQLGHKTVVVDNGAAAVCVSSEWQADVAFVDVDCDNSDATGVASKLHGGEHTQLVALTSHRARVPGFTAHVLKPFTLDTVVDLLDSFDRN